MDITEKPSACIVHRAPLYSSASSGPRHWSTPIIFSITQSLLRAGSWSSRSDHEFLFFFLLADRRASKSNTIPPSIIKYISSAVRARGVTTVRHGHGTGSATKDSQRQTTPLILRHEEISPFFILPASPLGDELTPPHCPRFSMY